MQLGTEYEAPRTPVEEVLAAIVAEVLGVARVGRHDDFFALGGHSLLAMQVISRIREAFQVELPVRVLFESPTLAGLGRYLEQAARIDAPPLRTTGPHTAFAAVVCAAAALVPRPL